MNGYNKILTYASRLGIASLIAAWSCLAPVSAAAQAPRVTAIYPEKPEPGTVFVVAVDVPGENAADVEALEPSLSGPARYLGADVRPTPIATGATLVEFRFEATGAGKVTLRRIALRIRGVPVVLGAWVVDVAAGAAPSNRAGTWVAAAKAWKGGAFMAAVRGPEGEPAECPPFALEGAIVEPVAGQPGLFKVIGVRPGKLSLPALEARDSAGSFSVHPAIVEIRPLPAAAAEAKAVGGPWKLILAEPRSPKNLRGEVVRWDLRLVGPRSIEAPEAPSIRVVAPSGAIEVLGGGLGRIAATQRGETEVVSAGAIVVKEIGKYRFSPEPYPWFDTETGTVKKTVAPAFSIEVIDPVRSESPVPELVSKLAANAGRAGAGRDDKLRLERAAVSFVAGQRPAAYAEAMRLVDSAFPPTGAAAIAAAMASTFGNLPRIGRVLPPYGIFAVAAVVLFAIFIVATLVAGVDARKLDDVAPRRTVRLAALALAVFSAAVAVASIAERAVPRFVSLGGECRAAPSEKASVRYKLAEGAEGRVIEKAGSWTLVEPFGVGPAWAKSSDLAEY